MYPLKTRIIINILLIPAFLFCLYLILVGFSDPASKSSFIHLVIPYLFIVGVSAIILGPIVWGPYGHWISCIILMIMTLIVSRSTGYKSYNLVSLVLFGVSVIIHLFYKKNIDKLERQTVTIEKIKEAANILRAQRQKTKRLNAAFQERFKKYSSLRQISESFSTGLSVEEICRLATETAYNITPHSDAALIFVVDDRKQQLELTASKKASELPRIKSKNGDIFDLWVFKERQPLNVQDVNEDFRFDYKPAENDRHFLSLISVPIISQARIIGILRLNSNKKDAYTFDDLRLLDFISDIIASAINNARLYKTTEELSIRDSLTRFYNHRYLQGRLDEEINRARLANSSLSIIILDIDYFKDYNDRYGHTSGDKVLLGVSYIIRNNIKLSSIAARYGGEEFIIILPNTTSKEAEVLAEKIRRDIYQHKFILRRKKTKITISAGISSYSERAKDKEELLKAADFCLYKAKKEGRNRVCAA